MSFRIRAATPHDAGAIALVHVDTWRTTYHGIVGEEFLSSLSYERRKRIWEAALRDPLGQSLFVAEDYDGMVVGFAACGPARELKEKFDGELYAIYVLRASQGKGAGRKLVLSVAKDLKGRGYSTMLVWVLAENPFRRFYFDLGGKQVASKTEEIGGSSLEELGLGWESLDSLILLLEE